MFERLEQLETKYEELNQALASPDIVSDSQRYQKTAKAHSEIAPMVEKYREFKDLTRGIAESKVLAEGETDPEMLAYANEEMGKLEKRLAEVEADLKVLLLPKDPNDEKNVIVEIRAGTGGDEATLFAAEIFRMYTRYAENNRWKVEVLSSSESSVGGLKEVIAIIEGQRVFSSMKYESGVHRVQRVPVTEAGGRIHTSAATVAVLPEPEEVDVHVDEKDLRIDVFRASGAGGQHVNKTESAVRITHLPSGIVVAQQDEKSQHKNRARALKILKAKLFEAERARQASARAAERKGLVGSGDRSERIRTYNFPQGRVTDHRINLTLYKLERILSGDELREIVDALVAEDQANRLAELEHEPDR
jgi:peptide chain release factor 1